ncbi:UDP-N-acetylmuramoyl-L-alanyl-D-glutamate--2,6-diaminopimelate ligase [Oceanobacillus chungangensis]|uniref:UDP-N-acetylmuramoyl-L-alanyl-D-glutamate--2,6-diaminopimelate ligase n=1 Tax=Oceanobacillus chungangensis TaxID=1229152 RepID=A0A3D8PRP0_9BACI|nr:UDP-N-acetylmuramoyl-L-alanyl-D-glutamate--2,6-diaminopimelate ligase [Oceanobacillus chungangensis]RDW17928.1 UDP-N-acetylmuramoyl-L-alanyl-D-glutamate--2,6-diaminopimelate ligase [Oceanobacillus chungangensis]
MKLKELLSSLSFYNRNSFFKDVEISDIAIDSREVKHGCLFICINGFTVDGHQYVDEAVNNGAAAIVAEQPINCSVPVINVQDTNRALAMLAAKFYQYPTDKLPLIGVTGTNGKTTITYLLEKIFNTNNVKTGIIGTIQTKIGNQVYPIENTTPNALILQRTFRQMIDANVEQTIMEVSSHALDLGRVYGCEFDIAIFTNLSQDHLDYHKTLDDYLHAKSLLFAQLGNSYHNNKKKFAIINQDDSACRILKRSTAQEIITYGCKNQADVMASNITLSAKGSQFRLITPIGNIVVNSKLIGMFNVYNMLAATAAAIAANIPLTIINTAMDNIQGVDGRFETVSLGQSFGVIVDYAHTPDSLENVLQTSKEIAKRKVYVVVGCGGDRDRSKRPLMAAIAIQYADYAIFTSDNPRTEDPNLIIEDMIIELTDTAKFEVIVDRKKAINKAIQYASNDDIVLIAGKGHETYQQIGHVKYDFDDREIAREAIKAKEK